MGFASDTLPLTRSFKSFNCEEDFEESDAFSGCGCLGELCPGIWPRRKRNTLLGGLLSDHQGDAVEGRLVEEDIVKDEKLGSGPSCYPKWKRFIQRLCFGNRKKRTGKFCYDATSYALNFDDGRNREEDSSVDFSFSSRYAAPPPRTSND